MAVKKFLFSDGNTRGIRAESERKINTQYQQATPLDCHALMGQRQPPALVRGNPLAPF